MDCCFILIDESVELNNDVEFLGKNISLIKFAKMNNKNSYEALIQIMRQPNKIRQMPNKIRKTHNSWEFDFNKLV